MRTPQPDPPGRSRGTGPVATTALARHAAPCRPGIPDTDRHSVIDGRATRPPVHVMERVTVRGVVWQVRCGGCYVNVDGRLIEIGSGVVTTETIAALIEALQVAATIAEPTT